LTGCVIEADQTHVPTGDGLYSEDGTVPVETTKPDEDKEKAPQIVMAYYTELSMNPYECTDYTNRAFFPLLYQSLFVTDQNYNVAPMLCGSYVMSEDMKNYTFYVDKNARFADGDEVTGEDVTASLLAAMSGGYYVGRFSHVKSISNTRDGGVFIQLDTPYENLPILLDIPIVKASGVADAWPMGTGAYYQQQGMTGPILVRRTDWWCRATLAATAAGISLVEADTAALLRDDFEFGRVSMVCADPGSDNYVDFRCDYELWGCESGVFLYLACNEKSSVFSNQKIRAALTYAIDRSLLVSDYYGGFAIAATLPASPNSPHYNQKLAAQYAYNPETFQKIIQEVAPAQKDVTLLVNSADSRRIRVARKIAEMLSVGQFKVIVNALSGTAYTNALSKGNFDLHLGQTKLSPNMDLSPFFAPKGSLNFGSLSDAGLYALCQEALANGGNYYTLHQKTMQSGMLCPILFRSYAIYGQRGLFSDLNPARDNVFWYSLGKTMEDCRIDP
jgi:peptide/nickel transport system substrate-binding protein